MPTVRRHGQRAIQFLPKLQMQSEPRLPQVPTRDSFRRQVLPELCLRAAGRLSRGTDVSFLRLSLEAKCRR